MGHITVYCRIQSAGQSKSPQGQDPARGRYFAHPCSKESLPGELFCQLIHTLSVKIELNQLLLIIFCFPAHPPSHSRPAEKKISGMLLGILCIFHKMISPHWQQGCPPLYLINPWLRAFRYYQAFEISTTTKRDTI